MAPAVDLAVGASRIEKFFKSWKRRPFSVVVRLSLRYEEEPSDEVVVPFKRPLSPVTAVRSTLLTSSLAALREHGLFERYSELQDSPHRDTILHCVAGEWLPLEVGFAHYRVCDALGLTREQQLLLGRGVSRDIHDTFLGLVVRAARSVGISPWTLLAKGDVLQTRLIRGGGIQVTRVSERAARVELALNPLFELAYFRNALLGIYMAGVGLLARNVSARLIPGESKNPGTLTVLRVEWC